MFKTILFPLDQSRESREAADVVIQLAKIHGSDRIVLLSVVEDPDDAHSPTMASAEAIAELLKTAQTLFEDQGLKAEIIEKPGKPAFIICDVADEVPADLIVMGCRGTGLTEEGAADSVTNRVINLAPCPVLIVP
ncbi:universal stress protein [Prochlorothrix hollandica]|uniref:Universal stress protein n=1 Tax=Prochlorothrix hollandica PCC 9006 = CALU 1027 TaxID=317619 RepID=A0A0M2PSD7_PROHO|nr:universal stress protein [Prochlorothrix hollandica]KKI98077.1 universal stress protein [Prochlorothrix hollandica PCC 9006 = CALU 1027]